MTETTRFSGTASYLTNEALEAAVNCALVLKKPLLVRGEPGTGKTLLAEAVAEATGAPLITWHVKRSTRAQEALALAEALQAGVHDSSLDGFYYAARALMVHRETHLDAFDQVIGALRSIARRAKNGDPVLKPAPHFAPRARLDETLAARS